jgi:uncharacterized protein HemX
MSDLLREVQAVFGSDVALQAGMAQLRLAGFDRAEISLPHAQPAPGQATPEQGAEEPTTPEDNAQMRTIHTSMAGSIGALAAAGATIATGGAAGVALAAAAAVGIGAGGIAHAMTRAGDDAQHEQREEQAARGELVLAVLARDAAHEQLAVETLRAAGALRVEPVTRLDGQILAREG